MRWKVVPPSSTGLSSSSIWRVRLADRAEFESQKVRNSVQSLIEHFYHAAPGWVDGTTQFGALIREHLRPEFRVLDLGAGSGKAGPVNFQGEVLATIGIDPDWYISHNPRIDYAVMGLAERLPLRDASFDVVFCDWVVEHLARPEVVAAEVLRVLRPEGYFIFRTGNLCHYSYAIAAATPHHQPIPLLQIVVVHPARSGFRSARRDPVEINAVQAGDPAVLVRETLEVEAADLPGREFRDRARCNQRYRYPLAPRVHAGDARDSGQQYVSVAGQRRLAQNYLMALEVGRHQHVHQRHQLHRREP